MPRQLLLVVPVFYRERHLASRRFDKPRVGLFWIPEIRVGSPIPCLPSQQPSFDSSPRSWITSREFDRQRLCQHGSVG